MREGTLWDDRNSPELNERAVRLLSALVASVRVARHVRAVSGLARLSVQEWRRHRGVGRLRRWLAGSVIACVTDRGGAADASGSRISRRDVWPRWRR